MLIAITILSYLYNVVGQVKFLKNISFYYFYCVNADGLHYNRRNFVYYEHRVNMALCRFVFGDRYDSFLEKAKIEFPQPVKEGYLTLVYTKMFGVVDPHPIEEITLSLLESGPAWECYGESRAACSLGGIIKLFPIGSEVT